jgi:NADH dehydrogenase (ubiquinone) Fe-S protein 1
MCGWDRSPTMARCSAAKAQKNPETNFMAPGEPNPQVLYGPGPGEGGPAALRAGA